MLVLALETTSLRGSVALVESGQPLAEAFHEEPNAHGERLPGLIDQVVAASGREQQAIDRVAVGRGPGAFTGLRIGLALGQGIAAGLAVPAVGIGSLRAMAFGMSTEVAGRRWPILDARRGELFLACYDEQGEEQLSPRAVPRERIASELERLRSTLGVHGSTADWLLGVTAGAIFDPAIANLGFAVHRSQSSDWPTAVAVGQLACRGLECQPAAPEYLRDADAVLPNLPPSPLATNDQRPERTLPP